MQSWAMILWVGLQSVNPLAGAQSYEPTKICSHILFLLLSIYAEDG
jgi:hypothetical protein